MQHHKCPSLLGWRRKNGRPWRWQWAPQGWETLKVAEGLIFHTASPMRVNHDFKAIQSPASGFKSAVDFKCAGQNSHPATSVHPVRIICCCKAINTKLYCRLEVLHFLSLILVFFLWGKLSFEQVLGYFGRFSTYTNLIHPSSVTVLPPHSLFPLPPLAHRVRSVVLGSCSVATL